MHRIRSEGDDSPIRISTFNLVDLAGSENAKMTNIQGERAREAKHINQSLLTLSLIIHRLSEGGRQHLPFRDSKLTRLLQVGMINDSPLCSISISFRLVYMLLLPTVCYWITGIIRKDWVDVNHTPF